MLVFSTVDLAASRIHTGCKSNEEHKDGSLWIAVANGGRDGGEPLFWVTLFIVGMM